MTDLLADYERKRARAETHFQTVNEAVRQFTEREIQLIPGRYDVDAAQYIFEFPTVPQDPNLALVVGDCIYNLRASLDYLISSLVLSTGEQDISRTEFPIYSFYTLPKNVHWDAWASWWETSDTVAKKIAGTPPKTRAILKQLQPLNGVPAVDPNDHPLTFLQELSNRDKHRRLNLVATRIGITFTDSLGNPKFPGPLPHGSMNVAEPSNSHTQRVTFLSKPDDEMEMYLRPAYDIVFDESRPPFKRSVIETLASIRALIDARILPAIKSLLPNSSD